ncbi:hypothetical protein [Actinomyces sp. oral taxon 180]|uniref:hypothetical protein n=1 Tax=Actinomyces sp. oral taxon 180 TaxID=651609 RepID=UPI0001F15A62|nr:hypothetical protein [Actinomyces sp. oral taxon 180]EFU61539.1 conserved hypothetical protein [Actinomyces sp. oral taxon 180 str. F0310]
MTNALVMLQTNSNQPFIFSSPRLREQIGASFEITLLSRWVEEAAFDLKVPSVKTDEKGKKVLPSSFWVSDSSGKVIVRFTQDDGVPEALARTLIREVTLRALTDAPGLDVTGVFIPTDQERVVATDLDRLDREFSAYSLNRRPAAARFPQFPFLERADESALPASAPLSDEELDRIREYASRSLKVPVLSDDEGQVPTQTGKDKDRSLSLPSRVKRAWSRSARQLQLKEVIERQDSTLSDEEVRDRIADLNEDPFQLERAFQDVSDEDGATKPLPELSSVGVIHIDGNGVGAIMRDLGTAHRAVQKIGVSTISDEVTTEQNSGLQSFIMEVNRRLDDVVKEAIALSWYDVQELSRYDVQELTPDTVVPIAPVLVGGDDVTVYTDGRYAIPFAEAYIRHYEELTKDDSLLSVLAIVAGGKKTDAPERDCFRLEDYIVQEPGPLTASAGAAIVGRNFPFHIAYDLAEGLVSRGKKLGKKPGASPCSTIDFHVLRDTTVLDPQDTLDEYEGRTQRPFLVGHYAPERIGDATTASASDGVPQTRDPWKRILRAVAAFNGRDPDSPDVARSEPFPRARANRIVKLLAQEAGADKADKTPRACLGYVLKADERVLAPREEIEADESREDKDRKTKRCKHPICTILAEWSDAQENASGAKGLVKRLTALPSQARLANSVEPTEDCVEQVRWLLDLIDLSENLPDGYAAHRIAQDADGQSTSDEASGATTAGGAK